MRETTFTELRSHAKAWFDLVEAGETVRVLRNGKPIADIHPHRPATAFLEAASGAPAHSRWCRNQPSDSR